MRRVLIGVGTPLGNFLKDQAHFCQALTYAEVTGRLRSCEEITLVSPKRRGRGADVFGDADARLIEIVCAAAKRVIFLSSLSVYPMQGLPLDEESVLTFKGSPQNTRRFGLLPALYEHKIRSEAHSSLILRLPHVFGPGFTTGIARHLVGQSGARLNRVAIYQWYPALRLPQDIVVARYLKAPVVNLCSEPVAMGRILDEFFPGDAGTVQTPAPYSRLRTRHAEAFGGMCGYIMSAECILEEMRMFIGVARKVRTVGTRSAEVGEGYSARPSALQRF